MKNPYERSTLQLMNKAVWDEKKEKLNSIPYNSKTHSKLKEKKFIPLYAEDLPLARWLVTHIYEHYTFEQSKFKKDFVVMNQKAGQTATSLVEKDFYKLLNNSNFGIDCRNNIDSCYLDPIYDDFLEISYIKKFCTIFNDDSFRDFFSPCLLREEIYSNYSSKIFALNKEDRCYEARKKYIERVRVENLDAVDSFEKTKW